MESTRTRCNSEKATDLRHCRWSSVPEYFLLSSSRFLSLALWHEQRLDPPNRSELRVICPYRLCAYLMYRKESTTRDRVDLEKRFYSSSLTDDTGISKQPAIFSYRSLTLLKPEMMPVGLPWASWQWKANFGGSRLFSSLEAPLPADRRILVRGLFEAVVAEAVVVSNDSSFLRNDLRLDEKNGMLAARATMLSVDCCKRSRRMNRHFHMKACATLCQYRYRRAVNTSTIG